MPLPTPLISATALQARLAAGTPTLLLDCGFDLADPTAGERAFAAAHLPGAHYLHLDRDLSGAKNGRNGRHPLPAPADWAATLGRIGVTPGTEIVCHDDHGGVYAARAWWLLRSAGHAAAAVLDGGRAAWLEAGGGFESGPAAPRPEAPPYPLPATRAMPTMDSDDLAAALGLGRVALLDARAPERFRGDVEPLDPVAGHIPGAINRFFKLNLGPDGRFLPAAELREAFGALAAGRPVVHQCGSGVTACHNLLAMEHAGLDAGMLYPGSWSAWCSDPARPVARGDAG